MNRLRNYLCLCFTALCCCSSLSAAHAQTSAATAGTSETQQAPSAKPIRLDGCVTQATDVKDAYVFSSSKVCAQLKVSFKLDISKVLDHQATFEGVLQPATDDHPALFTASREVATAEACKDTCMLQPPPERGLHKKKVGLPGATDGETQAPPQP